MCEAWKNKDYTKKGLENYPKAAIVLTNVLLLLWFGFAAYGMSASRFAGLPVISIVYPPFAVIMLGFVLRKHLCTHCYYYNKLCGTGWGKLSSHLFKGESGNYELGMKLAGLTWGLLTVIPTVAIPIATFLHWEFLVLGGIGLTGFLAIMVVNQFGEKRGARNVK